MTDLSSITPESRSITITNPKTAEPIGLTITLRPSSSPEVREVQRRMLNENLRNKGKLTAEKLEANRLDALVAATEGWDWEGDTTWHGEKPEATAQNFRKVYKEARWIRD